MLFNTLKFAIFLGIALVVYRLIQRWRWPRLLWLLLTSYLFYASWDPRYLVLIIASTLLDWFVGQALSRADGVDEATERRRKGLLAASVVGNLAILGVFKYGNFALESVEAGLAMAGLQASLGRVPTELPVGISFYTFQTMSYTIDIYRRRMAPAKTFWEFALFVAFFPQLVAGPIVRASEFLPQLERRPRLDARAFGQGVFLILAGLIKKMVLADSIGARLVDPFFLRPELYSGAEMLISTWSFYFQVYLDFSGYTDVAMGAALLFGFTLPENFKRPALSRSPLEHWGRWHVTMMTWLRDYLYVPLGGSRLGRRRTLINIVIVFTLGGLWHGAGWTYAIMGLWNGVLAAVWSMVRPKPSERGLSRALEILLSFHMTAMSMVFLRPYRISDALEVFAALGRPFQAFGPLITAKGMLFVGLAVALHVTPPEWKSALRERFAEAPPFALAVAIVAVGGFCALFSGYAEQFYYFQF